MSGMLEYKCPCCDGAIPVSYTHLRRDVAGYAAAATEFDRFLADFLPGMREGDLLMICLLYTSCPWTWSRTAPSCWTTA